MMQLNYQGLSVSIDGDVIASSPLIVSKNATQPAKSVFFSKELFTNFYEYLAPSEKSSLYDSVPSSFSSGSILISTLSTPSILMPTRLLDECVYDFLDADSIRRFNLFASYVDGWDSGKGKSLSPFSTAMLNIFIRAALDKNWLPSTAPSIFMTYDGYLQLIWEDANRNTLDLEFTNNSVEYYLESSGKEGEVLLNQINDWLNSGISA